MTTSTPSLIRSLTVRDAIALVVGTVIGTGVFLKAAGMAQQLGSPIWVLLAWGLAGPLSVAGALSYAELGAMFPRTGGEYVFLDKAYGKWAGFLYGWTQFAVVGPGVVGAVGTAFAIFLSALIPMGDPWIEHTFSLPGQPIHWQFGMTQMVAIAAILLLAAVNCLGAVLGSRVQMALTAAKLIGIAAIIIGVFFFSKGGTWVNLKPANNAWPGMAAFGAAMMASLWAYTGWYVLPLVSGEVIDPQRNVPRGLIIGNLIILAAYLLTNLSYFYALPLAQVATSNSTQFRDALPVAAKAVQTFLGPVGSGFISVIFVIATLSALNGMIMAMARIPYAMARDGFMFKSLGVVNRSSHVPVRSIIVLAVWGCLVALTGTFDQITTYALFSMWLFYGLTVGAVLVLRRTMPDIGRPYRTPGYPFTPVAFVLVATWLLFNTVYTNLTESMIGLFLIAVGLPLYFYFRRRRSASQIENEQEQPLSVEG